MDDGSKDGKIIFVGQRSCGRSALLAEFGWQCRDRGVLFLNSCNSVTLSRNHLPGLVDRKRGFGLRYAQPKTPKVDFQKREALLKINFWENQRAFGSTEAQ